MQMGKKKLALDHLIVQKINDEESVGDNVQSILTYGAQALFESDEGSLRDIVCKLVYCQEFTHDPELAPRYR
jgi:chromodomain-helicase-DNA-binding protein 4